MRRALPLGALGFTLFACQGEGPGVLPDDPSTVVRPERVDALTAALTRLALPDALAGDATLAIAVLDGTGALVGGAAGLYEVGGDALVPIDDRAVTALAALDGTGIVVGHPDGVSLWNGTLVESPLREAIDGMAVASLLERSGTLFIGTRDSLFLLEDGELLQFDEVAGASRLAGYAAGPTLVIDDRLALRADATPGWSLQDLTDESRPSTRSPPPATACWPAATAPCSSGSPWTPASCGGRSRSPQTPATWAPAA